MTDIFTAQTCVNYRATVSAHSSLVVLLVFIDTYFVFVLVVLEQINVCMSQYVPDKSFASPYQRTSR